MWSPEVEHSNIQNYQANELFLLNEKVNVEDVIQSHVEEAVCKIECTRNMIPIFGVDDNNPL